MAQNKLRILLILSLLLTIRVHSQDLAGTNVQYKNVLLEEYTGINCASCALGHETATGIMNKYPGRINIINVHSGDFAEPVGDQPDYRTPYGEKLRSTANANTYPSASINRHIFPEYEDYTALQRYNWEDASLQIMDMISPVNIGMESSYNESERKISIHVEVYYTSSSPESSNRLNLAILQNNVIGPQAGQGDNYIHQHMLKDLITGQFGDTIYQTNQNDLNEFYYEYILPEEWPVEDMSLVAFVAEDPQEVYTAEEIKALNGTTQKFGELHALSGNYFEGSTLDTLKAGYLFDNYMQEDSLFIIQTNTSFKGESFLVIDSNRYEVKDTLTISPNTSDSLFFYHIIPQNSGIEEVSFEIKSKTHPEWEPVLEKHSLLFNTDDLIVHSERIWNGGTAADYDSLWKAGLRYSQNKNAASLSIGHAISADDENALKNVKAIYYNPGMASPQLDSTEIDWLQKQMKNGKHLFIGGQDLGYELMENGNDYSQDFYTNWLHAELLTDGNSSYNTIHAEREDTVIGTFGSSKLWEVYGSSYFYPDGIAPIGDLSKTIISYTDYPETAAGIRTILDTVKIVYLAFGPEMVKDSLVRNEIFKSSYAWFHEKSNTGITSYPEHNTEEVNVNDTLYLFFEETVKKASNSGYPEDSNPVQLIEMASSEPHPVSTRFSEDSMKMMIIPESAMETAASYALNLLPLFENVEGIRVSPFSTTFTTTFSTNVREDNSFKVQAYPNPTAKKLIIKLPYQEEKSSFQLMLYDLSGQLKIRKNKLTHNNRVELSVGHLQNGTYVLYIFSGTKEIFTKKIVINSLFK